MLLVTLLQLYGVSFCGVCGLGLAYFIEEDFKRCWQGALLELH
jgi:hypothetical protein